LIAGAGWPLGRQAWGYYHLHAAEQALARRDFGEARERLARCRRVWPSDGTTLLLAARAAAHDGDDAEAERLLGAAAKVSPRAAALERNILRLRAGDLADAERYFAACQADRDRPETKPILEGVIEGALRARHLGLAERSLGLWEETQTGSWDRVQAQAWRGELAYLRGQLDVAVVHLREAVASAPGNDATRLRLAEVLIPYAPAEAKEHLEVLRSKRPHDRDVLIRLASCHRALGEPEEAVRLLDELLARSPRDLPALLERGRVALDLRQLDEAERWFRRAEAVAPQHRDVALALVRCLQLAGRAAEAEAYRDRIGGTDATPGGPAR
jgi:tetratricopeptide (TPR) repeat protein